MQIKRRCVALFFILLLLGPYFVIASHLEKNIFILTTENGLYKDVDSSNSHYLAIRYLTSIGVVEGYDNGYFKPNEPIKRAELMKILMDSFYGDYIKSDDLSCFRDVPSYEWFTKRICKAKKKKIIDGFKHDGLFHPEKNTTRAEASKMILNAMGIKTNNNPTDPWKDVSQDDWFYIFAKIVKEKNLFPSHWTYFYPHWQIERGLACELIFRIIVMRETGMDRFDESVISSYKFGAFDPGVYEVKQINTDDTIILTNKEVVRLIGIDRPNFFAVDCFYRESHFYMKENLLGKKVRLKKDVFGDNRNPQGELLRYIYFDSDYDHSFNYHVLMDGYAYLEGKNLYQFSGEFQQATETARTLGNGLWANERCIGSTRSLFELHQYPTDFAVSNNLD